MNIEQYRALKAQEEASKAQPPVEQPTTPKEEPTVEQPTEEQPTEEQPTEVEEDKPITVEIDGKEVTIDELKNGYLRQSDYTRKSQEVSRKRKEVEEAVQFYEHLKQNPEVTQQLQQVTSVPRTIDPTQAKVVELEQKVYDMMLEREIETLQSKYDDFEVMEVIEMASQKQLTNLEDAYHLVKSSKGSTQQTIDVDKLKEDLRKELLKEIEGNVDTSSIIASGKEEVVKPLNTPTLSQAEIKVATSMGMTPDEYAKWRDVDKKK